jgi:hypothetical protein
MRIRSNHQVAADTTVRWLDLAVAALKPRHPHTKAPTPISYSGGLMTLRFMLLPRSILAML